MTADEIFGRFQGVKRSTGGVQMRCPAHDDEHGSLSGKVTDDGKILLHCHANCKTEDVVKAAGLTMKDLFPSSNGNGHPNGKAKGKKKVWPTQEALVSALENHRGPAAAKWLYYNAAGVVVGAVLRWNKPDGSKEIMPLRAVEGGWQAGAMPKPRPLYGLLELLALDKNSRIYFPEGEKCVDHYRKLGLIAVTTSGGAGAPGRSELSVLDGFREVVLTPDADNPGEKFIAMVAAKLLKLKNPPTLKMLRLPGLCDGEDVCDFHDSAESLDDLRAEIEALADMSQLWEPPKAKPKQPEPGNDSQGAGDKNLIHLTDLGNARRIVERHGHNVRYCHPFKKPFIFNGVLWKEDDTGAAIRLVKETQSALYREVADKIRNLGDVGDDDERKQEAAMLAKTLKHCLTWEDAKRINASFQLLTTEPGIPVTPSELNCDPWLLNCLNGTIDLRTGRLCEHRREDLITKVCPVHYDPNAACPLWLKTLDKIMAGKQSLITFLQRAVGYSLTGDVGEQCLFFFYGLGANGKTVFLMTIKDMLGDYAMQSVAELLMVKNNESHPTERADLFGKRFVATIETEEGKRMAEAIMKQLTGGDSVRARKMCKDFFEFNQTWKIFLAANHKPQIRGNDHGVWRRIKVVPFAVTIQEHEKDTKLMSKLRAEWPGILRWAVEGCLDWQREGLAEPAEVTEATANYRTEQDTIQEFIDSCCFVHKSAKCQCGIMLDAYQKFAGDKLMTQKEFKKRMSGKGYESQQGTGGYFYFQGLGLPSQEKQS